MKKIYTLFVMLMFTGYIFAQSVDLKGMKQNISLKQPAKIGLSTVKHVDASNIFVKKSAKSTHERWFDYAITKQNQVFPTGGGDNLAAERLFPDTTVKIKYSNGTFAPWIHAISVVLDPTAEAFKNDTLPELNYNRDNKFKVDSLAFLCIYDRHNPDESIVDTLEFEVVTNVFGPGYYFTGMMDNYGYDTVYFVGVKHDAKINYVKPATSTKVITKKIPLTAQTAVDTLSNGFNYIYVPISDLSTYTTDKSLAIATIRFIPGYTWIPNQDTLNKTLNEVMFLSYQENGPDTYGSYKPKEYNVSQILPNEALYTTTSSFYKASIYIPSVAYSSGFTLQNHILDFKLVTNNTGISENTAKSVKLSQNVPNPANNSTRIPYELKGNNNVTLTVTDLTGNTVMVINEGKQMAGNHVITLNTGTLSSGMYYYTLNADNTSLTRKMIINK